MCLHFDAIYFELSLEQLVEATNNIAIGAIVMSEIIAIRGLPIIAIAAKDTADITVPREVAIVITAITFIVSIELATATASFDIEAVVSIADPDITGL